MNAAGDGAADVAVADDANGLAGNLFHVELFPAARLLIAEHAAEIFGKVKNRGESELAQRWREDSASVGERNRALDKFRKQDVVEASRTRVNPAHIRGWPEMPRAADRASLPNAESLQHRLSIAVKCFTGVRNDVRHIREHRELRIGRHSKAHQARMSGCFFIEVNRSGFDLKHLRTAIYFFVSPPIWITTYSAGPSPTFFTECNVPSAT